MVEWSEIIRGVISKSNKRALRDRFQITSMISDQNCTTRSSIATLLDTFWNRTIYVPVKPKLKHRPPSPRAYLWHLAFFPARERGNLMNLVFPRAGHLITTHRGWGIWSLASISSYESRWYHVGWYKPSCIQSERYPIRGGLAEKQRLAQALFGCIWRYSRTIYIIFGM